MRDQRGPTEAAVLGQRVTPIPQAGAEVEHDRLGPWGFERDARGVASVAKVRLAWARRGTADPVERDVEQWAPRSGLPTSW
jgi:hypothetical protein